MNRLETALAAALVAPGVALLAFMFAGHHRADETPQPVPVIVRELPVFTPAAPIGPVGGVDV